MKIPICVLLIFLIGFLAYIRATLAASTGAVAAALLILTKISGAPAACLIFCWTVFLLAAIFLNTPLIRRRFLTDYMFSFFRSSMPSMSSTEREALEAGTVWWDGELFSGRPDWKKLRSAPKPGLSREEEDFINGPVEELCGMLDDWRITEELQDLPLEVWDFLKQKGFFGMIIPKKYGGLEFSALAHSGVVMKIASRSISAAVTAMVPNSLGPAELILHYGTDEQKNYYLPRLAKGVEVPCFALTGPEAGSDAASMPDTGIVCRSGFEDQKDILGIRLNWEKRYITLAPSATVLGLAFKLLDPSHLLEQKEEIGITLALVPTNISGISIGTRHFPLNSAFQVGPTWGKDVFIPIDRIIGGPARAGQGWRMLMECLAVGRSISLPALSVGSGKLAGRVIGAYARVRRQFKMSIGRFEGVEDALARIGGNVYLMDAARLLTACAVDRKEKPSVISAMVKFNLTERARKILNDAMDIQGGSAICMGPRNLLARVYQSLPISITVEGSNTLTRSMIVFGQGALRCHPYLQRELKTMEDPDKERGKSDFDKAIISHIGLVAGNAVRSLWLGVTGSHCTVAPGSSSTRPYYKRLARMSAAFALAADLSLLVLGGALKRKEKLSGRLADIFSNLYLMSAVLKRFEDQGSPAEDLPFLRWACDDSLHAIQESFYGLFKNFPNRYLAMVLRLLTFPLGRSFFPPSDRLGREVADLLLSPGTARDRLTCGIFLPSSLEEPLGRLEDALAKTLASEPVEKKIQQAIKDGLLKAESLEKGIDAALQAGVINEEEAAIVHASVAARREVVRVDDFPRDKWKRDKMQVS
ncbi:MAG: acyl-CoA dehydrogenase [Nitrospinae bacterium]|nr:acyl-CoA dehydrogenase [Nitrospinota bacterium]